MPAETHALAHFEVRDRTPGRGDGADDLVTGHQWIAANTPLVLEHAEIAVADAAVLHVDLDLMRCQRPGVVLEGL